MSGEFEARRGDSARAAIELIEKAMEGVTPGPWQTVQTRTDIQRLTVAGPSEIVCGLDGICEPDRMNDRLFAEDAANMRYIAACNPLAMSAILAEARKAVEMEREIAKLRGLIRDNGTPRFNAVCERAEKAEACLRDFIKAHHDGAGLLDCVDNKGERYTSHFLDEAISRARTLLNGGPDVQG